ncbi:MAG: hypothetical protein ACLUFN_07620 [Eubacterium sp.]
MRLINADKLSDDILHDSDYDNDTINHFIDLVDKQHEVDAESVVHGHWERNAAFSVFPFCSICNSICSGESDYCPHCGARMDEEAE